MKPDTHEVRRRRRPRRRLVAFSSSLAHEPNARAHCLLVLLLLSLTLYPPSPSVPDRSRPDFMNCKRTVAVVIRPVRAPQVLLSNRLSISPNLLSQSGSPTPLARSGNHSRMSATRMARLRLPAVFCFSEARWKQLHGCSSACRESFLVFTFGTCFKRDLNPASRPCYLLPKQVPARLETPGVFSKRSLPTS